MKFTKHEKEIIRKINTGEVYDILSYLKAFNLTTFRKLDKEVAKKRLVEKENGATYQQIKHGSKEPKPVQITLANSKFQNTTIYEYDKDIIEYVPATLTYAGAKQKITTLDGAKYSYDYIHGINFTNSFDDVKRFLVIWQYLKAEGLIIEVDKETTREDYEIFLEYKPIAETSYKKYESEDVTSFEKDGQVYTKVENYPILFAYDDPNAKKDFRDYIDYYFEYNKSYEKLCQQFIGKQIFAGPDLALFVDRHFHTKEQINTILNLIPAYAALVLTLIITIYQEYSGNESTERIYNQLSSIEAQLAENTQNSFTAKDLENIEKQLDEILNIKFDDTQIQNKLDEILTAIESIEFPQASPTPTN